MFDWEWIRRDGRIGSGLEMDLESLKDWEWMGRDGGIGI